MADAIAMRIPAGSLRSQRPATPGVLVREITRTSRWPASWRAGARQTGRRDSRRASLRHRACRTGREQSRAATLTFIGSGPGQWLHWPRLRTPVSRISSVHALDGLASVFDQSDSRVLLELSGDKVRDVLAKGVAIDLHPRAFKSGDAALTTASHLAMQLWRTGDAPTFRPLVLRAYFESFWHWLAASAAEYGVRGAGAAALRRTRLIASARSDQRGDFNLPNSDDIPVPSQRSVRIARIDATHGRRDDTDTVAVEEPLEIRIGVPEVASLRHQAVSITMRTPGDDFELAAGFLFTEGILQFARSRLRAFITAAAAPA